MSDSLFSGSVSWQHDQRHVAGAFVSFTSIQPELPAPGPVQTGADGRFEVALAPGSWRVRVVAPDAIPVAREISVPGDVTPETGRFVLISRVAGTDQQAGKRVLLGLLSLILGAVVLWGYLHAAYPSSESGAESTQGYLWARTPWLWLDMAFFALIGILSRLAISVGTYVRFNRYFANATWQHMTLVVVIPVVTTAFVFFLTSLGITLGAGGTELDISQPEVRMGLCFLAALVPWALWERLLDQGRQVFGEKD